MSKVILFLLLTVVLFGFKIKELKRSARTVGKNSYPIRAAYIDRSASWYGDRIAAGLGVPGYATPHQYNYIILAFWSCAGAPKDMAMIWASAYTYFAQGNSFGNSTAQIQQSIRKIYNNNGIKIMVSAFGDSENPTSAGSDPVTCGTNFGNFILANNFDGGDVDWQDNQAMNQGKGEAWLISFTKAVRAVIGPDMILSHCPQAPYFKRSYYMNGGYYTINEQVGDQIDFYMLQFYNQVDSQYNTYQQLFVHATGTSFNGTAVSEVWAEGVPLQKIVVAKPILTTDATNTGWISQSDLGNFAAQAYNDYGWYAGIAHWQYPSDLTGAAIGASADQLIALCAQNENCI